MNMPGLSGILGNGRFQGALDLAGRAGNGMAGAGGNAPGMSYDPAVGGLAGIRNSVSQVGGAPIKNYSTAMPVQGGRIPQAGNVGTGASMPNPTAPNLPFGLNPTLPVSLFGNTSRANPINPLVPAGATGGPTNY